MGDEWSSYCKGYGSANKKSADKNVNKYARSRKPKDWLPLSLVYTVNKNDGTEKVSRNATMSL